MAYAVPQSASVRCMAGAWRHVTRCHVFGLKASAAKDCCSYSMSGTQTARLANSFEEVPKHVSHLNRLSLILVLFLGLTGCAAVSGSTPPVFRSASSQFTFVQPLDPAPTVPVRTLDGKGTMLRRFRGRVVVLNFWATWCLPCVYEMPTLDRLAATSDPTRLAILAVSIDRSGARVVVPFIKAHRLEHLPIYLDPERRLGALNSDGVAAGALPLWGLPITYILDKQGRVVGYLTGAAKWDSPQARKFLDHFLE